MTLEVESCIKEPDVPPHSFLQDQVGGNHYSQMKIQPVEFIYANQEYIGFIEGLIIRYLCRWKFKDGLKDLLKVKHLINILIEFRMNEEAAEAEKDEKNV
tara:strand:- start:3843 stop:4142 length:300 start_codon:yes stop_codon:yes gene_type:complete